MPLHASKPIPPRNESPDKPETKSGIGWAIAITALIALGAGTYFYFGRSPSAPTPNSAPSVASANGKTPTANGGVGAGIATATQGTGGAAKQPSDQIVGFGKVHLFGDLEILIESASQGYGDLHLNQSVDGHPLTIGNQKFTTGLGTHAVSRIRLALNARYHRFSGGCGADMDAGGTGTVAFKILHDKSVLFSTPVKKRGEPVTRFNIPVQNLPSLDLIVEDGGDGIAYDHADWVDLKLE